jgi:hypothetical protein
MRASVIAISGAIESIVLKLSREIIRMVASSFARTVAEAGLARDERHLAEALAAGRVARTGLVAVLVDAHDLALALEDDVERLAGLAAGDDRAAFGDARALDEAHDPHELRQVDAGEDLHPPDAVEDDLLRARRRGWPPCPSTTGSKLHQALPAGSRRRRCGERRRRLARRDAGDVL